MLHGCEYVRQSQVRVVKLKLQLLANSDNSGLRIVMKLRIADNLPNAPRAMGGF